MIQIFRGYVRTKEKKPIQKFKGIDHLPTLEEVSKFDEYAGILNNEYTVMDVDDADEAERTYKIVVDKNLNCRVTRTTRGMHFIFKKNNYANKGNTHQTNALGFTLDIRTGENQYIVVKKNGKVREIIRDFDETREVDEFPKYFAPIRSTCKFTGMKEGDGRNGMLYSYIITLVQNLFSKEECIEIIEMINEYAFDEPLSEYEIKQICRDEAFKDIEITNPEDEFGCLKPKDYSDVGQAEVLSKLYKDKLRYSLGTHNIVFRSGFWQESEPGAQAIAQDLTKRQLEEAENQIKETYKTLVEKGITDLIAGKPKSRLEMILTEEQMRLFNNYQEAQKYKAFVVDRRDSKNITATLKESRPMLELPMSALDANPFLLCTPGGTLDMNEGISSLREHRQEDFITKITLVTPSDKGKQLWEDSLNLIYQNNQELIDYVQMICGLASIGKVFVEALVIAYGEGSNGKSTFWNTISKVMGLYSGNISADTLTIGCKRNIKPEMAEIKGKRILIAKESQEGARLNEATVKQLCSTDDIFAEKKYKDPFSFTPCHTLILYTNHLPRVGATDNGIWRRLIVIPYNGKIVGKDDIKNYADVLIENAGEYVLKWIIEGAKKVIDLNYKIPIPKLVQDAIEEYKEQNDWFHHFLLDKCEVDPSYKESSSKLYSAYRAYCIETNEYTRNTTDFYNALDKNGFSRIIQERKRYFTGLKITEDSEFI